jgi:hypothetical protein
VTVRHHFPRIAIAKLVEPKRAPGGNDCRGTYRLWKRAIAGPELGLGEEVALGI